MFTFTTGTANKVLIGIIVLSGRSLLAGTIYTYQNVPPIPDRVVTEDGQRLFDRVFKAVSFTTEPLTDVQTTTVSPGAATVVDMKLEVHGESLLVDQALSRLGRGLVGHLIVEGEPNPDVFSGEPGQ